MKNFYSFSFLYLLLFLFVFQDVFSQADIPSGKRVAGPDQFYLSFKDSAERPTMEFGPEQIKGSSAGKSNAVNLSSIYMGTGQNAHMLDNTNGNFINYSDEQDALLMTYVGNDSHNVITTISYNGGRSFFEKHGPLQNSPGKKARHPNTWYYEPTSISNPLNGNFVWGGSSSIQGSGSMELVFGYSNMDSVTSSSSENYLSSGGKDVNLNSLSEGASGEFWMVSFTFDTSNSAIGDSIRIYKGEYNNVSQDVIWAMDTSLYIPWDKSGGNVLAAGPQIAFSPDGSIGWIGLIGDIQGYNNQRVYSPIFIESTDGGNSWGQPEEVLLDSIPWIKDSLQTLWVVYDSVQGQYVPASSGIASTAFDFDLTVDSRGQPHMGLVIGTGISGGAIMSGLAKFYGDVYGDPTRSSHKWDVNYVGPVLALRGEFGSSNPTGDFLTMDNYPQISRSENGDYIFYSWVDSDTSIIGFGVSENLAPNLRIAGFRPQDKYKTPYRLISDYDPIQDGKMILPSMAPIVREGMNCFELPILFSHLVQNDKNLPVDYYYIGADCRISNSDFQAPGFNLCWGNGIYGSSSCVPVGRHRGSEDMLHRMVVYPNPANDWLNIEVESDLNGDLELVDLTGHLLLKQQISGPQGIDISAIPNGIYLLSLKTELGSLSKKIIIMR